MTDKFESEKHFDMMYSIAFLVSCLFIYAPFYLTGKSLIAGADGFNQYYPAYYYIGEYIRRLLRGMPISTYDFTIGFGGDVIATLNYYGFGDVFNLTSVLFPGKYSVIGYSLSILIKMYLAGLLFFHYSRHLGYHGKSALAASILYIFSGFSLSFGLLFPTYMTTILYLPLMIWGIDDLLKSQKYSGKLVAAIALQTAIGFYFLYMDVIFGAIYVTLSVLFRRKSDRLHMKAFLVRLTLHLVIGIMISGVVLMPTLYEYLHSTRLSESSPFAHFDDLFSLSQLLERGSGILTGPGYVSGLGITFIAVLACVVGIKSAIRSDKRQSGDVSVQDKVWGVLLIILLLGYVFPFWGSLMNGLSYSTDRWTYMLIFAISIETARYLSAIQQYARSSTFIILISCVVSACCIFTLEEERTAVTRIIILLFDATVLIVALSIGRAKNNSKIYKSISNFLGSSLFFPLWLVVEVMGMAFCNNAPHVAGGKGYYQNFKNWYAYQEVMDSEFSYFSKSASQKTSFVRTDCTDTSYGASLITDTLGTTSYFSIQNSNLQRFYNAYEISGGIQGMSFCFQGLEGRTAVEALLSVGNSGGRDISSELIPFGTFFTSWTSEKIANSATPLMRNAMICNTVILDSEEEHGESNQILSEPDIAFVDQTKPVAYQETSRGVDKNRGTLQAEKDAYIDLTLQEKISDNAEYYLIFHNFVYDGSKIWENIYINGTMIRLRPLKTFSGQVSDFMVKVNPTDSFCSKGTIHIRFEDSGMFWLKNMEVRKIELSAIKKDISERQKHVLQRIDWDANQITGQSDENQNCILFMSIPYSSGWSCFIDGNRTKVYRADYGFSAALVPAGMHSISWVYRTPWLRIGLLLTIIGMAILIVLFARCWSERRSGRT